MSLTPKQQRFVAEYLVDLNAKQAAIRAGYSPKSAEFRGSKLLADAKVRQVLAEKTQKQLDAADVSTSRVLEEYRRLAFVDFRSFFDQAGNLKPVTALTAEQGAMLASGDVVIKNVAAGDGITDRVYKIKFWDKIKALDSLAKYLGLLVDRVEFKMQMSVAAYEAAPQEEKDRIEQMCRETAKAVERYGKKS